jgi:hypothetical protein
MAFTLDGTIVRWSGATGIIRQATLATRDLIGRGRDTVIVDLKVEQEGKPSLQGRLRFTSDAYLRLPGNDDVEKTAAVARRLVGYVAENGLVDGFFLSVDANDDGVQIFEAADRRG